MSDLAAAVSAVPFEGKRRLIAIAGAPASGKSTLAAQLNAQIANSAVVPMDGFHLDNRLLAPRGLLPRKGAPETFDIGGLVSLVERLATDEDQVYYPLFDRSREIAIAGAGRVGPEIETETVIVEGNYLLLDAPVWRELHPLWSVTVFVDVAEDELRARLLKRWHEHGYSEASALKKAESNDLPNARLVVERSVRANRTCRF